MGRSTAILCRNETCSTHEEQDMPSYYLVDCISRGGCEWEDNIKIKVTETVLI
jgi:hypothetical protein